MQVMRVVHGGDTLTGARSGWNFWIETTDKWRVFHDCLKKLARMSSQIR
jgi:hypothetical protein